MHEPRVEKGQGGPCFTRWLSNWLSKRVYLLTNWPRIFMRSEEKAAPPAILIWNAQPRIVKLAEAHPLQQFVTSASNTVWTPMVGIPRGANLISTADLPPGSEIGGHTFSLLRTPSQEDSLKSLFDELIQCLRDIEVPELEEHVEGVQLILSPAKIVSEWNLPGQKPLFGKAVLYSKHLAFTISGIVDLVGRSHPVLQSLKPGLDAGTFVIKTTEGLYALICELKTGEATKK